MATRDAEVPLSEPVLNLIREAKLGRNYTGLRERKKLATRKSMSEAAVRLAIEKGLDGVRVEEIAAAAGVSTRTFNNYFSSKYEAVCAMGLDRARLIGYLLQDRPAGEPLWDAVSKTMVRHYERADVAPSSRVIQGLRLMLASPQLQGEYLKTSAAMRDSLAEAIAGRADIDRSQDMLPDVLASAVVAASQVAVRRWCDSDPPQALRPLLSQALEQLASSFLAN